MKLNTKISFTLATIGIITIPMSVLGATTSCSSSTPSPLPPDDPHAKFIYDRTISLMGCTSMGQCVFGTGWIIDKPASFSTYEYWVATNWHVTHSFETLKLPIELKYADNSLAGSSPFINYNNFIKTGGFTIENDEKFIYDDEQKTPFFWPCIDLHILKINFDNGHMPNYFKEKFNNLNLLKASQGYISKFAKDSKEIRKKTKYFGGYPARQNDRNFGSTWEAHKIDSNELTFFDKKEVKIGANIGHPIGNPDCNQAGISYHRLGTESYYYYDISPQYGYNHYVASSLMSGGASGSMLITEDDEICGIYWGGMMAEKSGDNFLPYFSLMQTDNKDFLANYIEH